MFRSALRLLSGSKMVTLILALELLAAAARAADSTTPRPLPDEAAKRRALQLLQSSPAVFVENQGQWSDSAIRFVLPGMGVNVGLTSQSLRFQLFQRPTAPPLSPAPQAKAAPFARRELPTSATAPRLQQFQAVLSGARPVQPVGRAASEQRFNYRRGPQSAWREGVPSWESVTYPGLYPGVDLVVAGRKGGLKYEFHVAPGADWRPIALRYEGIAGLKLRDDGALELTPAPGWAPLVDGAPVIYQDSPAGRTAVAGRFRLTGDRTLGFEVTGAYDSSKPLVIDPDLAWSSYVGGSGAESGNALTIDAVHDTLFLTGSTASSGWISGSGQNTYAGGEDAFVIKLSTASGTPAWSTYLGGTGQDRGLGIALAASGNIYVSGSTTSSNMPTGLYGQDYHGGTDAFLAMLNPQGRMLWTEYLGGSGDDLPHGLALDASGNVFLVGSTSSGGIFSDNPDTSFHGGATDGFVMRFSSDGSLTWGVYLGGDGDDACNGLALDAAGDLCVAGITGSTDWLTGGFTNMKNGPTDGFVARLSAAAGALSWGAYLGGGGDESASAVAVDSLGDLYVAGETTSGSWIPVGYNPNYAAGRDAFLLKIAGDGQSQLWGTYLGGSGDDRATAITIGGGDMVYVAGLTNSSGWATGGFSTVLHGDYDGFVTKLTAAGDHRWDTYLGGTGYDNALALATDGNFKFYLTGQTASSGWTFGGYDTSYNGANDAFVACLRDYGQLRVDIQPPQVAAAGVTWRRLGTSPWFANDATEQGILGGDYPLEFTPLTGWLPPADGPVTVANGELTSYTAQFTIAYGVLNVSLAPPAAIAAGAQWRRVGTTTWYDSDASEVNVQEGSYQVEFKPVAGMVTPSPVAVTVVYNQTTFASGTYRYYGSLKVTLTPPEAAAAGAQWRRTGTTPWLISDATEANVPAGTYNIEFSTVSGWLTPATRQVTVNESLQATASAAYVLKTGTLKVNIVPPEAVAAGAQWRRTGTTPWLAAGASEAVPPGSYTVEFNTIPNYRSPASQAVTVIYNQTTILAGTYLFQPGSLQVTLTPAAAVTAGAKWRRVGTTPWLDSGATEVDITGGPYQVEFKPLVSWATPATVPVTISWNVTSTLTGAYQPIVGSLQVAIAPPAAIAAGAQWRRTGTTPWLASGATEANVPAAATTVEFSDVASWLKPASRAVTISQDQLTVTSGTYTFVGSLQVTLTPPEAVAAGAQWRRVGTTPWLASGATEANVPAGDCTVEFKTVAGWISPALLPVTVIGAQTATASAAYASNSGSLRVLLTPPEAVAAGAQWRRTGTTPWLAGGATETGVPAGQVTIECKAATGFYTPATQAVTIVKDQLTVTSASYAPLQSGLAWSTYVGGDDLEMSQDLAFDPSGNILMTGLTNSSGWVSGGYDTISGGGGDAFVVKVSPAGEPLWSTFLGGSNFDIGDGITTDAAGNVYCVGATKSSGWVSLGYNTTFNASGDYDAFLVKLSPAGGHIWSTYLGGSGEDDANSVVLDPSGNFYIAGYTNSTAWFSGGYDTSYGGGYDGFVLKLNASGVPQWGTFLGGAKDENANKIALGKDGNLFVCGDTASSGWVSLGWDTTISNNSTSYDDGFAVKLTPSGQHLWSTYLGGTRHDTARGLAVDGANNAIVVGYTATGGWVSGGYLTALPGTGAAFAVKLASGGAHVWSTYLGGSAATEGLGVAVDSSDNIYVCGDTSATDWIAGGFDTTPKGGSDAFVAKLTPAGQPVWSGVLGGTATDAAYNVAVDASGNLFVFGDTYSAGWVAGGYDTTFSSIASTCFLARVDSTFAMPKGRLGVTISPPEAIAAGAKWRRVGTTTWRDAATTETGVVVGDYSVEFKPLTGWTTPATQNVTIVVGQASRLAGTYVQQLGSLQVTLLPPEAVAAGAQWRRTGTTPWLDSGASEVLTPGNYTVEFKSAPGWVTPVSQTFNLSDKQTVTLSAVYTVPPGSLWVGITPPGAVAAGAKWRRMGTTAWLDSATTETGLAAGSYTVEFKPLTGWNTPATQNVTIVSGQGSQLTATFVQQLGSLQVTITPSEAVAAGARWRRVGTTAWFDSATTETAIPIGAYSVEFKSLASWNTPINQDVIILEGQTALAFGGYAIGTGNLQVTLTPPAVVAAGARWRRVGTTPWLLSGIVEPNLPIGSCTIEFLAPAGWLTPPNQPATVTFNQTAAVSCAFSPQIGTLQVNLAPPAAVGAGAQWRRLGTTPWLASGAAESNIAVGSYTLEFKPLNGWLAPTTRTVTILRDQVVTTSATYATGPCFLTWSSYVGGSAADVANSVATDPTGNVYLTGYSNSAGWIPAGLDSSQNGQADAFVVKLSPAGQHLWSTYLGGGGVDAGNGLALDGSGNIFIVGLTATSGWGLGTNNATYHGGTDGFAARLTPAGAPVWVTYIGGSDYDFANGVAIDTMGNVCIAGYTNSAGWVSGGYHTFLNSGVSFNGFVLKLAASGKPIWSTYLGGWRDEEAFNIATDLQDSIYVCGNAHTSGWVSGGYNTVLQGTSDGFVVKLSSIGRHLWSTYIGGANADGAYDIAVDDLGTVSIVGFTSSPGWVAGCEAIPFTGPQDFFAARLSTDGRPLWSTYLGPVIANSTAVAQDAAGNLFTLCNNTVMKFTPGGLRLWSESVGFGSSTLGLALATDAAGNVVVVGSTTEAGWATGPYDATYGGSTDGFVASIHDYNNIQPVGSLTVTITPAAAVKAGVMWRRVGTTAWHASGQTETNIPAGYYTVEFAVAVYWNRPPNRTVTIVSGQTSTLTQDCGKPYTAVPPGAWRRY